MGANATHGALEVSVDGEWSGVCDDEGVDNNLAKVVCQSLGHEDGIVMGNSAYGKSDVEIRVTSAKCTGTEKSFTDCQMRTDVNCTSDTYVSIYCSNVTIQETGKDTFTYHLKVDYLNTDVYNHYGI